VILKDFLKDVLNSTLHILGRRDGIRFRPRRLVRRPRSRRLSRQPFVNPADGMFRPPPVLPRTQQPPGRGCSWRLTAARLPHDEAGRPTTRRNPRIVAEYLHKAGWRECTIGAGTTNGGDYGRPHRGRDSRDCHAEAEAGGGRGAHPESTKRAAFSIHCSRAQMENANFCATPALEQG